MAKDNSASGFFRYRGRSMWPGFQEGDLLEVQPTPLAQLQVGDCITYRSHPAGTLVTHRIFAMRDGILHTRGDAALWPDDLPVSEQQLVGRVIGRYRLGALQSVAGGVKGRIYGGFYHYVGRLDPQRGGRGGRAARLLRTGLQWLASWLYRRGRVEQFGEVRQEGRLFWLVGQRPWASLDLGQGRWWVPWPQSLLIDPARLPQTNKYSAQPKMPS